LALVSGALLFLSFPPYGAGIVAWVALVPLLFALPQGSIKTAMATGFLSGLVCNVGLLYWLAPVIVNYGQQPWVLGLAVLLSLAAYLSIYFALFAGGVYYLQKRGLSQLIGAPLLWTCLEYLKSHLLTGFPWENLAYSQFLYTPLIQSADITGIYGISFLIIFINALICDIVNGFVQTFPDDGSLLREVTGALLMFAALLIYGQLRIHEMQAKMESAPAIDVTLIQGNIDQGVKWEPRYQEEALAAYNALSRRASPGRGGLIVWPETAAPFYFQDSDSKSREVCRMARETGDWLLFGSPGYRNVKSGVNFLNSAFLLSPLGSIAGRYDKVHLVPYGEYVPLRGLFPFAGKLVAGTGDIHPGKGYAPLFLLGHKIGVLICYEGIFPEAGRTYKKEGAELLVNITNDAWFGTSSAPYQHLSMTVFRAVENRLYVLRAANTGISAIIDPTGKIISQTALFVETALPGQARFIDNKTFYVAYGDLFVYLCFISLLLIYMNYRRKKDE